MSLGDLVALASALCWASGALLGRSLSRVMSPVWVNALRCAVGSLGMIALLPWTLARVGLEGLTPYTVFLLVLSLVLGIGIGDTVFFESVRRVGVARAMPIASSFPLLTAVLAVPLLGESLTVTLLVGIVVIVAGIWLVTVEGRAPARTDASRRELVVGGLLALLTAFAWAGSALTVQPAMEVVDVLLATTIRLPIATVLLVAYSRLRLGRILPPKMSRAAAVGVVVSGVLSIASTSLFLWAVASIGSARTAALNSASPLFAAPLAVLLFGERMTLRHTLGICIIFGGVVLIVSG